MYLYGLSLLWKKLLTKQISPIHWVQSEVLSSYFLTNAIPLNWSDVTKHEISFNLNLIKPPNIPLTNQPKLYNISPFDISTKNLFAYFLYEGSSNDPLSDKMISDCIETLITENIYHLY